MEKHPITPPQWQMDAWQARIETMGADVPAILLEAARWGADQELEACCEWLQDPDLNVDTYKLRAARRPKPPSLKEQALDALESVKQRTTDPNIIEPLRRALEQLND
jgi:hypothetical protein